MTNDAVSRLRLAETSLLGKNVELYFAGQTLVSTALRLACGDARRAADLLAGLEPFLAAAVDELRERQPSVFDKPLNSMALAVE